MPDLLSLLTEAAIRSTAVLAAAFVLLFAMMRASASERHLILLCALWVVALLPLELLFCPKLSWTILLPEKIVRSEATRNITGTFWKLEHSSYKRSLFSDGPAKPSRSETIKLSDSATALIFVGMLVQLLRLVQAFWVWRKVRYRAVIARLSEQALEQARIFAGAERLPPIFASDQISVPLLAGWLRPVIILPADSHTWTSQRLGMVLCHELAHLKRRDPLSLPLICALRVFYWWHPLVRIGLARLLRERETACDDLVLAERFSPADYADLIVSTARRARAWQWQEEALAMASLAFLSDRIKAILDPRLNRRLASRTTILTATATAFAFGLLAATAQVRTEGETVAASSAVAPDGAKPKIELDLTLVAIDNQVFQRKADSVNKAVTHGIIPFLIGLNGTRVLARATVLTRSGSASEVSLGNKSLDVTADQATSHDDDTVLTYKGHVRINNSAQSVQEKVSPTVTRNQLERRLLYFGIETTPTLSNAGTILVSLRYSIRDLTDYKNPDDFGVRTTTIHTVMSSLDGRASGFYAGPKDSPSNAPSLYEWTSFLTSPEDEQSASPFSISFAPSRLAVILRPHLLNNSAAASASPAKRSN